MVDLIQFTVAGLTVGSVYALIALGFTLIYNASRIVNFAQGEFVMIGGMATVFLTAAGVPLHAAAALAIAVAIVTGMLLYALAIDTARGASDVTLIIITIGASILLRGLAQIVFDKQFHKLAPFSSQEAVIVLGAVVQSQTFWILGGAVLTLLVLHLFLNGTLLGKAVLATAANRLAAQLVGINVRATVLIAFATSAAIGALAGVLVTPITLTSYDVGTMLALKGFAAVMLGGIGSPAGAVLGGLLLGLMEALGTGYISSAYKDAIAFIIILGVLLISPHGLLGQRGAERV